MTIELHVDYFAKRTGGRCLHFLQVIVAKFFILLSFLAKFTRGFLYFLHYLRLFRIDSLGNLQLRFDLNVDCEEIYKRVENEKSTSARLSSPNSMHVAITTVFPESVSCLLCKIQNLFLVLTLFFFQLFWLWITSCFVLNTFFPFSRYDTN